MGSIRHVAWGLRRRLIGVIVMIAVVMGVAGGLATGLVAGGLRARSAVDRLMTQTRLPDIMVFDASLTDEQVDEMRTLPHVDGAAMLVAFSLLLPDGPYLNLGANPDGRYGVDLDLANIVRGRAAAPGSADEVVLGEKIAEALGVDVGDVIHFKSFSPEQVASWHGAEPTGEQAADFLGPDVDLNVVGIGRHPADLASDDPLAYFIALPPGFYHEYHGRVAEFTRFAMVDIGINPSAAEEGAVARAVQHIAGPDSDLDTAGEQSGGPLMSTLDFVGMSMMVLAATIGLAGLIVGALFVSRTVVRASSDSAPLVALGMTNTERAVAITVALAPAVVVAGVATAVVATLSTAFLPFGLARHADPSVGLRLDLVSMTLGAVATAVVVLATIAALAFRHVRRRDVEPVRRSAAVDGLARAGLSVGPLVGVDLAIGTNRIGSPVGNRFASVAMAMATATAIGALVLSSSVGHLESTPTHYGWTWDYVVSDDLVESLADDSRVEMLAVVRTGAVAIDGRPVVVRGMESVKGAPPVLVVDGRPPGIGEIVLGKRTMDDLGVDIGDQVVAEGSDASRPLRVVGEAVFAGIIDVPEASAGAAVQASDFEALGEGEETGAGTVVGLADGVDRSEFERELGGTPAAPEEPVELARLREIEALPWILAGFLGLVGFVAVVNAVFTTTRRRAHDLAVLRTVGLAPTGVRRAVTIQATVLAAIGLVIGVPLGLVLGHTLWRAMASSLGVVVLVDVPWLAIVASAVAGVAAAALLAVAPARTAVRRSIADALRTE